MTLRLQNHHVIPIIALDDRKSFLMLQLVMMMHIKRPFKAER